MYPDHDGVLQQYGGGIERVSLKDELFKKFKIVQYLNRTILS